MDRTALTQEVAHLFRISGHKADVSVSINHREIDIRAEETQGLVRKVILVECADYQSPVGVEKFQSDLNKLVGARDQLQEGVVLMHVSRSGYTQNATGLALDKGVSIYSLSALRHQLVNFDAYIDAVERDGSRNVILNEYQPTKIHYDGRSQRNAKPAMEFITEWLSGSERWLTILGDYGVGKSSMLKRFLYWGMDQHKSDPERFPLPLFIPLQRFTKRLS